MSETTKTPAELMVERAQIMVERYALDAEDAEPLAKAAARLFRTNPAHATAVLNLLRSHNDSIGPEFRSVFAQRFAWATYQQSVHAGGVLGIPPGLTEEAFVDQTLRDKVAAPILEYLKWREAIIAAHGGKKPADILIDGFALADPVAESLASVAIKFLRHEPNFASDMLDMTRSDSEPDPVKPENRERFLCGFAAVMYSRCDGRLQDVPGNLKANAFEKGWIRKLVAKALATMVEKVEDAETKPVAKTPEVAQATSSAS